MRVSADRSVYGIYHVTVNGYLAPTAGDRGSQSGPLLPRLRRGLTRALRIGPVSSQAGPYTASTAAWAGQPVTLSPKAGLFRSVPATGQAASHIRPVEIVLQFGKPLGHQWNESHP